jgi:hypothetical protein
MRLPRFEERSLLPSIAACAVASAMRERLTALFGMPVALRLFEPQIPTPQAWGTILRGATLYRVRGSASDAVVVLRPTDAAAFASAAFGETVNGAAPERRLSPLERAALDRMAAAIAGTLGSVCGERDPRPVESVPNVDRAVTYFELSLEQPMIARIGVALSRDPAPGPSGGLRQGDMDDLPLSPVVVLELEDVPATVVSELAPGRILPIPSSNECRGSLRVGGRVLARGSCGVTGDRYALEIEGMAI